MATSPPKLLLQLWVGQQITENENALLQMLSVTLHLVFSFISQIDIWGMPHKNFRPAHAHLPEVDTKWQ